MIVSLQSSWEQTLEHVIVTVNIKGVNRTNMDIMLSETYLKINSRPHYFDLDLLHAIDEANSKVLVDPDAFNVTFTLRKLESIEWPTLKYETKDKDELLKRREESIQKLHKRMEDARMQLIKTKRDEEQRLMESQWEIERSAKGEVHEMRKAEKEMAEKDLFKWENAVSTEPAPIPQVPEEIPIEKPLVRDETIFDDVVETKREEKSVKAAEIAEDTPRELPPVRSSGGKVKLKFTPRLFKTPAREDKDTDVMKKYELWKSKTSGKPNEENPTWIKEKGDSFFRRGNYEAAVNAYTEAIRLDPSGLTYFSNRAACFLQMQHYARCVADCDHVINTVQGEQQDELKLSEKGAAVLVKVLARRGTAHFKCGNLTKATEDYALAVELDGKKDESLVIEYETIRKFSGEASDGTTNNNSIEQGYKHQGDIEYKQSQFDRAVELYSQAINMYPCYFTAHSNRAACYLQLKKYIECIEDCSFIVNNIHSQQDDMSDTTTSKGNLLLKALVRRAEALFSLEDYRQAYRDYEQASRMSPDDDSLMKELEKTSEKLSSQVQAEWFQNRGRYFFKNNDFKSALHLYTLAVNQDPSNPVHYSNRALCYLKLENYVQCVNDCNTGLTVLNADDKQKFDKLNKEKMNTEGAQEVMKEIPTNILLTPALQVKLYHRRAQAYKMLEEWERSLLDFKRAHHLAPKETSLLKDMNELQPIVDKIVEKRAQEVNEKEANELVPVVES